MIWDFARLGMRARSRGTFFNFWFFVVLKQGIIPFALCILIFIIFPTLGLSVCEVCVVLFPSGVWFSNCRLEKDLCYGRGVPLTSVFQRERSVFMACQGVHCDVGYLRWEEQESFLMFREAPLMFGPWWGSISLGMFWEFFFFCSYSLGNISLSWKPFL